MYNIFVGNLSFSATREQVKELFAPFGTVANVLVMERKKGKSRGYAFVDMPDEQEKNRAIAGLEGKEFMQRILNVTHVVPKAPKPHRPKKKFLPSKKGASDVWLTDQDNAPFANEHHSKPYRHQERSGREQSRPYQRDDRSRPAEERPRSSKPWEKSSKEFAKKGSYSKPSYRGDNRSRSEEDRPRSSKPWEKSSKEFSKKGSYSKPSYRGDNRSRSEEERPRSSKPWEKPTKEFAKKGPYSNYGPKKPKFEGASSKPFRSKDREGRSDERRPGSKPPYRKDAKSGKSGGWSKDKHDSFSQATGKSGFKKFNPLGGKPRTPRTRGERR